MYAGIDPITKREIRLKATAKTEQQAHIELGRLLKEASEGRTSESDATVAKLLDEYAPIAPWDVSTRQTNEGFIRRTIKPALGPMKVRKVRGPILDKLYAELKRCGDLACNGRPFIEHRNVPVLVINPRDSRPAWQQAQIELGRLLKEASEGRTPESGATVAKVMDEYAAVAEWDVSTRQTNEGFIQRTIEPALGPMKVRKVRGPILDKLYAEAWS